MGYLLAVGAESGELITEQATTFAGFALAFSTSTNGRGSTRCFDWLGTGGGTSFTTFLFNDTTRETFVLHAAFRVNALHANTFQIGFSNVTNQYLTARVDANGSINFYRGTTLVLAGTPSQVGIATDYTVRIEMLRAVAGYFRIYLDGALVVNFVGDTSAAGFTGSINKAIVGKSNSGTPRFDDLVVIDPTDGIAPTTLPASLAIVHRPLTVAGLRQEQATGTVADVDEIPVVMTDAVTFSAPDRRFTARTGVVPTAASYIGLLVQNRVQRSGSGAGDNARCMFTTAGTDTFGPTVLCPTNGFVNHLFALDGSGAAWTKATLDAVLTADGAGYQTRT